MCGIVGSIGTGNSKVVLTGLERLEYRGYDSCGIAIRNEQTKKIEILKSVNRVSELIEQCSIDGDVAIGHTRWATHGGVNDANAHPHHSMNNLISLVHNGVIENYREIKEDYLNNYKFYSETDSEVLANLLEKLYKETKSIQTAIEKFKEIVEGSYALIVLVSTEPDMVYVIKNKTPIVIGKGKNNITISSDVSAVHDVSDTFYGLNDKEFALIDTVDKVITIYNEENKIITPNFKEQEFTEISFDLAGYDSFMLKEIEEQPEILRHIVNVYQDTELDNELADMVLQAEEVYFVASGTSYNSSLFGKKIVEKYLNIPCQVVIGSEFGYDTKIIRDKSLFIFVSQSGETADSVVVFNEVVGKYPTLAITNTRGSLLDRSCDKALLIHAGLEISVASTKAYTAQVAVFAMLCAKLTKNEVIPNEILKAAKYQEKIIKEQEKISNLAKELAGLREMILVGRLSDYYISMEAALKLKELTYINTNAYQSGELKHGPIALIEEGSVVLSLITQSKIANASRSNQQEIKARGGRVITISAENMAHTEDYMTIGSYEEELLSTLSAVVVFQLLTYYIAEAKGLDIDKPRNLAKSVTVE